MKPFTHYRETNARFISEFGFQSLPALETVATYAEPQDWNMTSYIMEHHQRNGAGNSKIITYMAEHFRMPNSFPSLVYLSQVLQAEAMRVGVEHWRRIRARCGGALYWQLNDCWPVASWSSIDYFGRWKALQYAARRFFAPVALSVEDDKSQMGLFITNDTTQPQQGEVRWRLQTLGGQTLARGQQTATAEPLATTKVGILDFTSHLTDDASRNLVFISELYFNGQRQSLQVTPFVPDKHLALSDPQLKATVTQDGVQLHITVQAATLARFVKVGLTGTDVIFSDNYFDLPAGEAVTITCPLPSDWTLGQAQSALTVSSLWDSYS
jgi:beta-mannosidase